MIRISLKTGTEGPRHDPYSYEEVTIERGDSTTTIHLGLAEYCKYTEGNKSLTIHRLPTDPMMLALCGLTLKQAKRILRKREEAKLRAHRSHGGMEWSRGYPGEQLLICKCGDVVDSSFNLSAIQ